MKPIEQFLADLAELDIKLILSGDRLRINAPQGVLTVAHKRELASRKAEILTFLRSHPKSDWWTIQPVSRDNCLPLSFAQQRLWILDQLEPGNVAYHLSRIYRLSGALNVRALERSVNEIIRRHEALRTTFRVVDQYPVQVIIPTLTLPLSVQDLRDMSAGEQEGTFLQRCKDLARQPFDLAGGPLLHTTLFQVDHEEHIFLLVIHHIVTDGWSMGLFLQELSILYEAFSQNQPSPLPDLPIQYADFAYWQRKRDDIFKSQLAYWKRAVQDAPPLLSLPTDRQRPNQQRYRGASVSLPLSLALTFRLKSLSQQEGVTLFMTLLTAFKVLLFRYSAQESIVVGTPIANRTISQIEGLIGFFVNTLVLRTELSGNPTFRQLLARVREVTLDAYQNQDLPFEKLVEELQPERTLGYHPLFQVMFILQNADQQPFSLPGLVVSRVPKEQQSAKFDLTLTISELKGELQAHFNYNRDLFEAATIRRMARHFQTLLEGIIANPSQPISGLPILTDAERHQLLVEWNDTATAYPRDKCIHQLFEAQVERVPDAVAVIFGDEELSYRELNARANQLAHYLIQLGVGPEVKVGICVERSLEMVVGLLGILKAGGAYVPLDPSYPKERLQLICLDANVKVLLSDAKLVPTLAQVVPLLDLGQEWSFMSEPDSNPITKVKPNQMAYCIYTSGSTGRPKGVIIEHQSLTNFLHAMQLSLALTDKDRLLAVTTISFDIAALELYLPLVVGGQVILASLEESSDGRLLLEKLRDVTIMQATPATWRMLLAAGWQDKVPTGIKLLCGGEALPPDLAQELKLRGSELWNMYGPTESTIWSTSTKVTRQLASQSYVPIGHPILNTQIYILDRNQKPVPIGVPGELHIAGAGLARGYLNRPQLTFDAFIPNPFGEGRLYRTGDLCRYLPGGNIEFLGRKDNQVKIRGFRVELGEIEAVLSRHPAVRSAVVVAKSDNGHKRLVAYIVAALKLTSAQLRRFLSEKLPAYMLPALYVQLDALPLTPNGKIDRRALPAPDMTRPTLENSFVAPRTPIEQILTDIWAELLSVKQVGIHDNFFSLGGHSLKATQVISRIRDTLQIELSLRRLFEQPTVAGLGQQIGTIKSHLLAPIVPVGRVSDLPLSFAEERQWFIHQLEPETPIYNISRAYRLSGVLNQRALEQSVAQLIRRHESLRTTFRTQNGQPVRVIANVSSFTLSVTDLSDLSDASIRCEVKRRVTLEAHFSFDLESGPLFRVKLLRLSSVKHVLLMTMHHIISDGWSMGILWRELGSLYDAVSSGKPSSLPDLPIQYADFAHWQRKRDDILSDQLAYWKKQLKDAPPLLSLPTDRQRPNQQRYRGASVSLPLSLALTFRLKSLSQQEGVTLFMTLLTAFKVLLFRYSAQESIVVGTPIANRTISQIEGLIGFFVNTLVLRTSLLGNPTFTQLLARVREVTLDAYQNQDLPFEKLVEELQPERTLGHHPLFQVMFILQNADQQTFSLPGLVVSRVPKEQQSAKFDLTLTISERQGELQAHFNYNRDLFEAVTIRRMARHFQTLLEGIIANPSQSISDLPILTDAERQQILVERNDTATDYPLDKTIHQLFEEQAAAERTVDHIAIVFEDQQLTYRELNQRANQLAHHLQTLGVGPEVLVGICVERSIEMVVGLLGILKAGGAYVPLEPNYPAERLAFMLTDANVSVLLTQSHLLDSLPEISCPKGAKAKVICLDSDWAVIESLPNVNLEVIVKPDNLVYVIYTSGSTGQPKGTLIHHKGLTNYVWWAKQQYTGHDKLSFPLFSSLSFDLTVTSIFTPLISGGKIVIYGDHTNDLIVLDVINDNKVDIIKLTPAHLALLATTHLTNSKLKRIIVGGEALRCDLSQSISDCFDDEIEIYNEYGPTETVVGSMIHRFSPSQDLSGTVPIGKPIANTQIYILDEHQKPVPFGRTSELYIAGDGVARGYLNRPQLTAEKFIVNPFGEGRLYKTGDLARWRTDGNIEFVGRIDHQVKIRGFRIELGEIETVLSQHGAVQEMVVMAREQTSGQKRLVAYLIPNPQLPTPSISELRNYLQEKLPDYMIPSAFVMLDKFPLTPNGKIDRKALPEPDSTTLVTSNEFVPPQTPTEQILASVWVEVLGVERVGVHDNFFELGGHSLLATQVVSRIQKAFQILLPLRHIFETPTIADLASAIDIQQADAKLRKELYAGPNQAISKEQLVGKKMVEGRL